VHTDILSDFISVTSPPRVKLEGEAEPYCWYLVTWWEMWSGDGENKTELVEEGI
jgi:hypothetical protein